MACLWREQPVGPQFFMTSAQRRSMARSHRSYRRMASASGGLSPAVDAGEFGHDVVQLDDDFGVGHPAVSHTLEVGGVPAASCLGGSGSSEGCSSAWFPAARSAGTTNGFQEHLWFATCRCCLSASLALRDGSSSKIIPRISRARPSTASGSSGASRGQLLLFPGQGRTGSWTTGQAHGHFPHRVGRSRYRCQPRTPRLSAGPPSARTVRDQPTDDRGANIDFGRNHLLVRHGHFLLANSASSACRSPPRRQGHRTSGDRSMGAGCSSHAVVCSSPSSS
jgi:hypothetical protein